MAVPQTYYAEFARAAAERGFDVLTYDYRGIGSSRPSHARALAARHARHGLRLDAARLRRRASLGTARARAATRRRGRPQLRRQCLRARAERPLHRCRRLRRRPERVLAPLGRAAPLPACRAVARRVAAAAAPLRLHARLGRHRQRRAARRDDRVVVMVPPSRLCSRRRGARRVLLQSARRCCSCPSPTTPTTRRVLRSRHWCAPTTARRANTSTSNRAHRGWRASATSASSVRPRKCSGRARSTGSPDTLDSTGRRRHPPREHSYDQDRNPGRRGAHRDRASREEERVDRRYVSGDGRRHFRCARRRSRTRDPDPWAAGHLLRRQRSRGLPEQPAGGARRASVQVHAGARHGRKAGRRRRQRRGGRHRHDHAHALRLRLRRRQRDVLDAVRLARHLRRVRLQHAGAARRRLPQGRGEAAARRADQCRGSGRDAHRQPPAAARRSAGARHAPGAALQCAAARPRCARPSA